MNVELLTALNEARAAKRRVCLVRYLDDGAEALVVDGQTVLGEVPADVGRRRRRRRCGATSPRAADTSRGRTFLQVFNPPLRLIVIGAVHIAQALAPMASLAGYQVTVIDPRRAFATDSRFPDVAMNGDWPDEAMTALMPDRRTGVVALTHDPKIDDPGLDVALRSEAFYIAALGSRRTHAGRLERLAALGPRRRDPRAHPWPGGHRHRGREPGRDRDLGHGRADQGAAPARLTFAATGRHL